MKYFEKVDVQLIHNKVLTANEKMVYIICHAFRNAPKGCRVSYQYLMERTGIKDKRTITKILDRLTLFGYLGRKQLNKKTLHIVFDQPTIQKYIKENIEMRNAQKRAYAKKKNVSVDKSKIIRLNDYLVVSKNAE